MSHHVAFQRHTPSAVLKFLNSGYKVSQSGAQVRRRLSIDFALNDQQVHIVWIFSV